MVASTSYLNKLLSIAAILYHRYGNERSAQIVRHSYDFIVIGGGSAGAIVASKLSENSSTSVLLIESGGSGSYITDIPFISSDLVGKTNLSRKYQTTIQSSGVCNGQPCKLSSGHVLGGSSTHNYLAYVRGSMQDLDEWAEQGNNGWTYQDLLPYMIELETYEDRGRVHVARGTHGPVHVTRKTAGIFHETQKRWKLAAIDAGYDIGDYNGPRQTFFADGQVNIGNGVRQSTDNVFLKPIMNKRKNLDVIMFSHVTRILFAGNVAIGVEYQANGTLKQVMAHCEIILSAGAFASPQILMLSGIGPAQQLNKFNINIVSNLAGVGRNLQDQLTVQIKVSSNFSYSNQEQVTKRAYDIWMLKKVGILATTSFCSLAYVASKLSINANDSQIGFLHKQAHDEVNQNFALLTTGITSIRTYSRGYVKLRSKDPFDDLTINPRYLARNEDRYNLVKGLKLSFGLMYSKKYREINAKLVIDKNTRECSKKFTLYSDDWLFCYVQKNSGSFSHYTGTCKMGPTSNLMAVVDDRLRVRNVKGLRVIDASIMPHITRGNTNAPTMMIGLKGAAMVKQDWNL